MNMKPENWQRNLKAFTENIYSSTIRFHSKISYKKRSQILDNCWEWIGAVNSKGYGYITIGGLAISVPLLSWFIYKNVDVPLDGQICHFCNNKICANPGHLYHATELENLEYAIATNEYGRIKLSQPIATQIREARRGGTSVGSLALKYKVNISVIYKVLKGETWQEN